MKLVKRNFDNNGLNKPFIDEAYKLYFQEGLEWKALSLSDSISTSINVEQNFMKMFSRALSEIIHLLQKKDFDQAYDIIDAFHWLPEDIAHGIRVNLVNFFITKVVPLSKKWGTSFVEELYDLLSINKFAKIRIQIQMKIASQNA